MEQEPGEQAYWDSLYSDFLKGSEPAVTKRKANEIFQLGFKPAMRLHLPGVSGVDFQPENYGAKNFHAAYAMEATIKRGWDEIDACNDPVRTNAVFFDKAYPVKRPKPDSLLQKLTLKEYILQMNTPVAYAYYTWSDRNFLYSAGRKAEYAGVDWLANFWYGRNLRIYTNMLPG